MSRYFQPATLDDALQLLARNSSLKIVAGGTDIYPAATSQAAWRGIEMRDVLDISRLNGMRDIVERVHDWHIGALATWTDLINASLPPVFDGLKIAAREVGGIQIQNRGTIGGNICNASPAADGAPPLIALDAEIACMSVGDCRIMSVDTFIEGNRKTRLRPGELVTGIIVPKRPGRGHFLKLGARRYLVISIAMVSGTFDIDNASGIVRSARIAVGACSAVAQRLPKLEARLAGTRIGDIQPTADDLAQLAPIDDVRADADYRRAAALQLVADLLDQAAASHRRPA